jgi:hypothetical protein
VALVGTACLGEVVGQNIHVETHHTSLIDRSPAPSH